MIRKACPEDVSGVVDIYDKILDRAEKGECPVGWIRGVYPTRQTAQEALNKGELFVDEENGRILAAAKINREQVPVYARCPWGQDAPAERVMVLHTLVVDPEAGGHGYGSAFVRFYEQYALENDCPYLRMDTNANNLPARRLYSRLGYREAGIIPCEFNGIAGVRLVCLEKTL